jgi:hypothetical protein
MLKLENSTPSRVMDFLTGLSKEESYCDYIAQEKALSLIDLTQILLLLSGLNEKYQTVEYNFLNELSAQEKQQFKTGLLELYQKLTQYLVKNHQELYTAQDSVK